MPIKKRQIRRRRIKRRGGAIEIKIVEKINDLEIFKDDFFKKYNLDIDSDKNNFVKIIIGTKL
jgi:hypothetical protein